VFLGFVNFYCRFIWNFLQLAHVLNAHMSQASRPPPQQEGRGSKAKSKKGPTKWYKPWSYPAEVKQAFRMLRTAFTKVLVLQHFDLKLPLMLITDVSDFAYAGILLQPDDTGNQKYWHPITYHSQKFADHEVCYHTHDKELHAIVKCFKQWQHYLEHAMHMTRMLTDHNNLKYFMSMKNLSDHQVHVAEELS
jgi:hypothetical protein